MSFTTYNQTVTSPQIMDWSLVKHLKKGKYSDVYLVKNAMTGQHQTMKAVPKGKRSDFDKSFYHETSALSSLQDIGGVVNLFYCENRLATHNFYIMEYLDANLDDLRMKNFPMTFRPPTILQLLYEMVNITEAIHARGIFHQDMKLSNFMIKFTPRHSQLKLVDFGMAATYDETTHLPSKVFFLNKPFSSPWVSKECAFQPSEEIVTIGMVAVHMALGIVPWYSPDPMRMLYYKTMFVEDPESFLKPYNTHVDAVVKNFVQTPYGELVDYNAKRQILADAYFKMTACFISSNIRAYTIGNDIRLD
uniref:Protein kinase domain-containing protein n=2 Tax=Caenorhabditis tropicalis TaxID=1561998 RepID=A0A1I7V1R9_9PELO